MLCSTRFLSFLLLLLFVLFYCIYIYIYMFMCMCEYCSSIRTTTSLKHTQLLQQETSTTTRIYNWHFSDMYLIAFSFFFFRCMNGIFFLLSLFVCHYFGVVCACNKWEKKQCLHLTKKRLIYAKSIIGNQCEFHNYVMNEFSICIDLILLFKK